MPSYEVQTFGDGLCTVYEIKNTASTGKMPVEALCKKGRLRYAERTVGMSRFTSFLQNDVEVSLVLRMPRQTWVSTQDVVIPTDGKPYRVVQVQYPQNVTPRCMDLTLERIEQAYAKP